MTRSRCPRRGLPEAPIPLQIKVTNWPPADEIDACNGDLIVAITEVIAGNTILTENHPISSVDLFGQTLDKPDIKLRKKEMSALSLPPIEASKRKKKRGPRWRRGDGEDLGAAAAFS